MRNVGTLLIALALAGSSCIAQAEQVNFENDLAGCATIKVGQVSTSANLVTVRTRITLAKPLGECRCLSALAAYSSSVDRGGVRQVLQEGLISLKSGGDKVFALTSEPSLVADKEVTVRLGCTGPL